MTDPPRVCHNYVLCASSCVSSVHISLITNLLYLSKYKKSILFLVLPSDAVHFSPGTAETFEIGSILCLYIYISTYHSDAVHFSPCSYIITLVYTTHKYTKKSLAPVLSYNAIRRLNQPSKIIRSHWSGDESKKVRIHSKQYAKAPQFTDEA